MWHFNRIHYKDGLDVKLVDVSEDRDPSGFFEVDFAETAGMFYDVIE